VGLCVVFMWVLMFYFVCVWILWCEVIKVGLCLIFLIYDVVDS